MEVKPAISGGRQVVARHRNALAFVAGDVLAIHLAAMTAMLLTWSIHGLLPFAGPFELLGGHSVLKFTLPFFGTIAGFVWWMAWQGHYRKRIPAWFEAKDIAAACTAAAVGEVFLFYIEDIHISRLLVTQQWMFALPFLVICRSLVKRAMDKFNLRQIRVVILGEGAAAENAHAALTDDASLGYTVVSRKDYAPSPQEDLEFARKQGAELVVLVIDGQDKKRLLGLLSSDGIQTTLSYSSHGLATVGLERHIFVGHEVFLLSDRSNLENTAARLLKRCLDITLSAMSLLALSPLLAAVALLIRRDGGPIIFSHPRVGRDGKIFQCFKFRSMAVDGDKMLERLLRTDPRSRHEWERERKLKNDPRITPLGRFLRKSTIDELPQLLNVLKGEMSLVGPRPVTRGEMTRYQDEASSYLRVRPGLTGLWQISGRNNIPYERRVELDGWYVRNWSPWIDVAIILMTIPAVLKRRGAY